LQLGRGGDRYEGDAGDVFNAIAEDNGAGRAVGEAILYEVGVSAIVVQWMWAPVERGRGIVQ